MSHWFDRLAVGAAEGPRMTRRASLERAAVMVLAAGPLAAFAARAPAAGDPCARCHASVRKSFVQRQAACLSGVNRHGPRRHAPCTVLTEGACLFALVASSVSEKVGCQGGAPCQGPNQDGNPPGSPTPPQLHPPGTDLCAPCLQVGGKCCYGSDPTTPCACIPPNRNCKDFCS